MYSDRECGKEWMPFYNEICFTCQVSERMISFRNTCPFVDVLSRDFTYSFSVVVSQLDQQAPRLVNLFLKHITPLHISSQEVCKLVRERYFDWEVRVNG